MKTLVLSFHLFLIFFCFLFKSAICQETNLTSMNATSTESEEKGDDLKANQTNQKENVTKSEETSQESLQKSDAVGSQNDSVVTNTNEESYLEQPEPDDNNKSQEVDKKDGVNKETLPELTTKQAENEPEPAEVKIHLTKENSSNSHFEDINVAEELEKAYDDPYDYGEEELVNRSSLEEVEDKSVKLSQEEQSLRQAWEQQVADFSTQEILTVKLNQGESYSFFDEVREIPSQVRLAYFVNDESRKVDFFVISPAGQRIYSVENRAQAYHEFNTAQQGTYSLVIDNKKYSDEKRVSIAIHLGNSTDSPIESQHLKSVDERLSQVKRKVDDIKVSYSFSNKRYEAHYKTVKLRNTSIVTYSLIESGTMVVILVVQLVYMRKLIEKAS